MNFYTMAKIFNDVQIQQFSGKTFSSQLAYECVTFNIARLDSSGSHKLEQIPIHVAVLFSYLCDLTANDYDLFPNVCVI